MPAGRGRGDVDEGVESGEVVDEVGADRRAVLVDPTERGERLPDRLDRKLVTAAGAREQQQHELGLGEDLEPVGADKPLGEVPPQHPWVALCLGACAGEQERAMVLAQQPGGLERRPEAEERARVLTSAGQSRMVGSTWDAASTSSRRK